MFELDNKLFKTRNQVNPFQVTSFYFFLFFGETLQSSFFSTSSIADTIRSTLRKSSDRTGNIGRPLSSLVSGGFDKLGYVPITQAIGECEGIARRRVEKALQR